MSWSDRRQFLAALALLPLAGCGFTPLYSDNQPASRLFGQIKFIAPRNRFEFDLRDRLETRLGDASAPQYRLTFTTSVDSEGGAIRSDSAITRINLQAQATFSVTSPDAATTFFTGSVRTFTAYSTLASPFATQVAAEDAERRLARALADQIVIRLAATSGSWLE